MTQDTNIGKFENTWLYNPVWSLPSLRMPAMIHRRMGDALVTELQRWTWKNRAGLWDTEPMVPFSQAWMFPLQQYLFCLLGDFFWGTAHNAFSYIILIASNWMKCMRSPAQTAHCVAQNSSSVRNICRLKTTQKGLVHPNRPGLRDTENSRQLCPGAFYSKSPFQVS